LRISKQVTPNDHTSDFSEYFFLRMASGDIHFKGPISDFEYTTFAASASRLRPESESERKQQVMTHFVNRIVCTEIGDFGVEILGEEDVACCEITMHDALQCQVIHLQKKTATKQMNESTQSGKCWLSELLHTPVAMSRMMRFFSFMSITAFDSKKLHRFPRSINSEGSTQRMRERWKNTHA
jgi:hypothetical protein